MKKVKISKSRKEHIRIFFRFLKEHSLFDLFKKDFSYHSTDFSFAYYVKNYRIRLNDFIIETVLPGCNDEAYERWIEADNKWKLYLYNNKIYGTPTTISKKVLLDDIKLIIIFYNNCEETVNEAKRICDIEGIKFNVN